MNDQAVNDGGELFCMGTITDPKTGSIAFADQAAIDASYFAYDIAFYTPSEQWCFGPASDKYNLNCYAIDPHLPNSQPACEAETVNGDQSTGDSCVWKTTMDLLNDCAGETECFHTKADGQRPKVVQSMLQYRAKEKLSTDACWAHPFKINYDNNGVVEQHRCPAVLPSQIGELEHCCELCW